MPFALSVTVSTGGSWRSAVTVVFLGVTGEGGPLSFSFKSGLVSASLRREAVLAIARLAVMGTFELDLVRLCWDTLEFILVTNGRAVRADFLLAVLLAEFFLFRVKEVEPLESLDPTELDRAVGRLPG